MEASLSSHKAEWKEHSSMHSSSVAFHPKPSQEAVDAATRTDLRVSEGLRSEELLTLQRAEIEQAIAERDALSFSRINTFGSFQASSCAELVAMYSSGCDPKVRDQEVESTHRGRCHLD
ncbi:unnamed protein product [Musa banksii]